MFIAPEFRRDGPEIKAAYRRLPSASFWYLRSEERRVGKDCVTGVQTCALPISADRPPRDALQIDYREWRPGGLRSARARRRHCRCNPPRRRPECSSRLSFGAMVLKSKPLIGDFHRLLFGI